MRCRRVERRRTSATADDMPSTDGRNGRSSLIVAIGTATARPPATGRPESIRASNSSPQNGHWYFASRYRPVVNARSRTIAVSRFFAKRSVDIANQGNRQVRHHPREFSTKRKLSGQSRVATKIKVDQPARDHRQYCFILVGADLIPITRAQADL